MVSARENINGSPGKRLRTFQLKLLRIGLANVVEANVSQNSHAESVSKGKN